MDKKDIKVFGVDVNPRLEILKMAEPPHRKAGTKVATVADLLTKLTEVGAL